MEQSIFALVPNVSFADELIESLQQSPEQSLTNISYVYKDMDEEIDTGEGIVAEKSVYTFKPTHHVRNGLADAAFGLVVVSGMVNPLGTVVAAGPLADTIGIALSSSDSPSKAEHFSGALTEYGVPSDNIKTYEAAIKQGEVLVMFETTDADSLIPVIEQKYAHDVAVVES